MELHIRRVVKILLHICNAVLLIYGIFLTVCGLMIVNDLRLFNQFLESKTYWLPYFITFNGIMMIVLSLFGFSALCKQNYKLLVTYGISALVVLLVEIAIITCVAAEQPTYADTLRVSLKRSFSNYLFIAIDKRSWDQLQRKVQCCGIEGPQDWNAVFAQNQVPASCCLITPDQPGAKCRNGPNSDIVYQFGCHQTLLKRLLDHWSVISLLAALAACIQTIVLFLSIIMAFFLKREKIARERQ